ncbi:hypothetical protein TNCV_2633231 [Trichonephila clavipes]|nr:hypothetical protein TNCV_2633231 [Trichonephila clavipes]
MGERLSDAFKQIRCTAKSTEASIIYDARSCTGLRFLHKRFQIAPEEEIQGIEVLECGGQVIGMSRQIHFPEHVVRKWLCTTIEKCSCMNYTFLCAMTGTTRNNSCERRIFVCVQVSSTLPRSSISPHLFGHFPRLAYHPPNGYYYRDFPPLNVVCDFMLYVGLSSPSCLLSTLRICRSNSVTLCIISILIQ